MAATQPLVILPLVVNGSASTKEVSTCQFLKLTVTMKRTVRRTSNSKGEVHRDCSSVQLQIVGLYGQVLIGPPPSRRPASVGDEILMV